MQGLCWDLAGDLLLADVGMHGQCFSPACKDHVIFTFVFPGFLTRSLNRGGLLPLLRKNPFVLLLACD